MRSNRRKRGGKRGEEGERTKERRQRRASEGGEGEREAEQQGLALWRAGTLASAQALVCVGRVTIDAD